MPPHRRRLIAVTMLSILIVTGLVIGCDSDDGPKVTTPAGNGGNNGNGNDGGSGNGENGTLPAGTIIRACYRVGAFVNGRPEVEYCQESKQRSPASELDAACTEGGGRPAARCTPALESCVVRDTHPRVELRLFRVEEGALAEELFEEIKQTCEPQNMENPS